MNKQKRGDNLKENVYAAAIEIMHDSGYNAVTFVNISKKSGVSRPSLYSHWDTPFDLLAEAVQKYAIEQTTSLTTDEVNTGSLRNDLINVFTHLIEFYKVLGTEFLHAFTYNLSKQNKNSHELNNMMNASNLAMIEPILERAKKRNEHITPVNEFELLMPFELIRYEMMVQQKTIDESFIEQFVDRVVLRVITFQEA